jgi:hypothetical protein
MAIISEGDKIRTIKIRFCSIYPSVFRKVALQNISVINDHGYVLFMVITISCFQTHHLVCNKRNTTGVTSEAGIAYLSGAGSSSYGSSNPVHGEVYSTQHYVIACQRLPTGLWFSLGPPASSTNKTDHHDITEILLKVALNTLNSNPLRST